MNNRIQSLLVLAFCLNVSIAYIRHIPIKSKFKYTTNIISNNYNNIIGNNKQNIISNNALAFSSTAGSSTVALRSALSSIYTPMRALFVVLLGFLFKIRNNFTKQGKLASSSDVKMESGWTKRGSGSGFARTVEVWSFAVKFGLQYVS